MSQVIPIGDWVNFFLGGGVVEIPGGSEKRQSPDLRSPEVGISGTAT